MFVPDSDPLVYPSWPHCLRFLIQYDIDRLFEDLVYQDEYNDVKSGHCGHASKRVDGK